jgi:hypothetical protein
MPRQTIIDTDYATLWYYPESKIVRHKWKKFIYGQEFRNVLNKGVDIFKQQGAQKWLSDDRENSALPKEDFEWGVNDWFPRVFGAGWKYWALVMPDKVAGQMNMERGVKTYIDRGLIVQVFEDPDEALKWLESV